MADGTGFGILGLGVCLPEHVRTNDFWPPAWVDRNQADAAAGVVARLEHAGRAASGDAGVHRALARWAGDPFRGARERRVIDDAEASSHLEERACRAALRGAGVSTEAVDLLVGYSQVTDDAGPGNHGIVARRLGLGEHTAAFTLEAGCASFLPQLTVAARLLEARDHRMGLLYQSSAISRVTDYESDVSCTVGDGAVAQVVGPVGSGLGLVAHAQRSYPDLRDGLVLAPRDDARWYDANEGLVVFPRDLAAVFAMGGRGPAFAREVCTLVMERAGVTPPEVDFFVTAQATAWYGEACAAAVGIPAGRFTPPADHFQRYGHLLAASAPLNLWVAWQTGRLQVGDLVLMFSPGVGFTVTATLMRWAIPPPCATSP